ncbi:MAG: putative family exoprotein, partial [Conexibacter sp.]|nr:putative family exoprotein [Conexibacter sp.]
MGGFHACALRSDNGAVECWGGNWLNQRSSRPGGSFTKVDTGWVHACAVRADGSVACWGPNDSGNTVPPAGTFTDVAAGFATCGIRTDATVACWGSSAL